ncbi:hypothetical protein CXG81DRAFT_16257 [Caulochytrium protostelioides]|uniref:Methionine synthase reductase n=1 Tax=Caulochytrium protostelioides TaxID=1555241 RepID=A0A4P9XFB5_9FUNG|nr:hypothetical protein CXG81DRAFT_16257 [Caulochytrium protostelioides]|eukprot:RKP04275.1 hypothetical protein CXG81DRAFT_16257 [Caulochytrium protostelioides]
MPAAAVTPCGITVLFGSETGASEYLAEQCHKRALKLKIPSECLSLDDWTAAQLRADASASASTSASPTDRLLVIFVSSTGDGDPPANAVQFLQWVHGALKDPASGRGRRAAAVFSKRAYALLGLGDSSYEHFGRNPKRVREAVKRLGAVSVQSFALADDAKGLEDVSDPWVDRLFQKLPALLAGTHRAVAALVREDSTASNLTSLAGSMASLHIDDAPPKPPSSGSGSPRVMLMDPLATQRISTPVAEAALALPAPAASAAAGANAAAHTLKVCYDLGYDPVNDAQRRQERILKAMAGLTKITHVTKAPISALLFEAFSGAVMLPPARAKLFPFCHAPTATPDVAAITAHTPQLCTLTQARCLSGPRALQRVIEVSIRLPRALLEHLIPGEALGIVCANPTVVVLALIKRLGLNPDAPILPDRQWRVDAAQTAAAANMIPNAPWLAPDAARAGPDAVKAWSTTPYLLLKYFVDLQAVPKKALLRLMADHCTHLVEKQQLLYLCSKQGAAEYREIHDTQVPGILQWLNTFPSSQIPLGVLVEHLPPLQPRRYSVTSVDAAKQTASIAFGVVTYTRPGSPDRLCKGVCSTWLDEMACSPADVSSGWTPVPAGTVATTCVPVFPLPRTPFVLHVPRSLAPHERMPLADVPRLLIAAGTGITPFMGFMQHLAGGSTLWPGGPPLGIPDGAPAPAGTTTWLAYSHRFDHDDDLFVAERAAYLSRGGRQDAAVSRSATTAASGITYVQDIFLHRGRDVQVDAPPPEAKQLWAFLQRPGACVYVCGSQPMARDLHARLVEVVALFVEPAAGALPFASMTDRMLAAKAFWDARARDGQYLREIW